MNFDTVATYILVTLTGMVVAVLAAYYVLNQWVYPHVQIYDVPIETVETEKTSLNTSTSTDNLAVPAKVSESASESVGRRGVPLEASADEETLQSKGVLFTGVLKEVNTGCFSDGECFVVVDKNHVTILRGWNQGVVGSIEGVESIADLESHIGERVEVYAGSLEDGTYTLYGSDTFYLTLIP